MKATRHSIIVLCVITSVLILTAIPAYADGKALFMNKCGACHAAGGQGPAFAPTKFASVQWARFFERNTHARKKDISAELTPAELESVKHYLMTHAADSDQPVAIGLR